MAIITTPMLEAATVAATSPIFMSPRNQNGIHVSDLGSVIFQSSIAGTGAITGTVEIYGNTNNSAVGGVLLATHTLSGTGSDSAGGGVVYPWPYFYAKVTAITGTGAAITVNMAG